MAWILSVDLDHEFHRFAVPNVAERGTRRGLQLAQGFDGQSGIVNGLLVDMRDDVTIFQTSHIEDTSLIDFQKLKACETTVFHVRDGGGLHQDLIQVLAYEVVLEAAGDLES